MTKNILKYRAVIIWFIILLFSYSCNIDRVSLNGPSSKSFPKDAKEAKMGLFGAYRSLGELDAASTPIWHVMDNITDIGYARPGNNYTSSITSALTTDNALAVKPWKYYYKTIARCHSVLDNLDKLSESMGDEKYSQMDAELRFIRAYCYSQLVELYGDVPLVKHSVNLDSANIPRTSKKEIRDFLLNELTEIADKLPVSYPNYGHVRATNVAAYMLKARIALYSKKFEIAAKASHKAIALSNGVYGLTPFNNSINYVGKDYSVGEPDISNIYGHDGYKNSKEWIWVTEYNNTISGNYHKQQYFSSSRLGKGAAYWGPTQDLISSFQCIDGLPITESPLYDPEHPFKNRDPRLDMYCARPHARYLGFQFEPNKKYSKVLNYWPVINGESNTPSSVANDDATNAYRSFSGYLWRKYVTISDYPSTSVSAKDDLNVGIFRYAELLLIYAEAKIESNDIDNSVYDAINQVRERAHMPDLPGNLSQDELRTALRYERKVELCGDGLRWFDIRRWGIAKEVMNGYIYLNRAANPWSKNVLNGFDDSYTPLYNHNEAIKYFGTQSVTFEVGKDELWPVPQSEMDVNENLEQNPGY